MPLAVSTLDLPFQCVPPPVLGGSEKSGPEKGEQTMTSTQQQALPLDSVVNGDCIEVMRNLPPASVDFILTDPPYLVNYNDRSGRSIANDDNDAWLKPAFNQMHRVLRPDSLCISFYSWNKADVFMAAWREAGFRTVGHIVFRKAYASNARFLSYRHESAYLLAKGRPPLPSSPVPDVLDWQYSGNRLHPTQKPVQPLKTLIGAFTAPKAIVLDPFCGSGSTLIAARELDRQFLGIELDETHSRTARDRLERASHAPPETALRADLCSRMQ
jgi:site-specific DNA-methyltransferase (adenine-specific)